jgi:hypothetical protein
MRILLVSLTNLILFMSFGCSGGSTSVKPPTRNQTQSPPDQQEQASQQWQDMNVCVGRNRTFLLKRAYAIQNIFDGVIARIRALQTQGQQSLKQSRADIVLLANSLRVPVMPCPKSLLTQPAWEQCEAERIQLETDREKYWRQVIENANAELDKLAKIFEPVDKILQLGAEHQQRMLDSTAKYQQQNLSDSKSKEACLEMIVIHYASLEVRDTLKKFQAALENARILIELAPSQLPLSP